MGRVRGRYDVSEAGRFTESAIALECATDLFNELEAVSDSSSSIGNLALCNHYEGRLDVALELCRAEISRAEACAWTMRRRRPSFENVHAR